MATDGVKIYGHHAPIFGLFGYAVWQAAVRHCSREFMCLLCTNCYFTRGILGLSADVTSQAFMYTFSRDLLSAAVRLGVAGPMQAVAMQRQLQPLCFAMVEETGMFSVFASV